MFPFKVAESSNGRTLPSGGNYLGSNPSSATLNRNHAIVALSGDFCYNKNNMENIIYPLASVIIVSLISLIGVLGLAINEGKLKKILLWLVSLSVGALFGDVFLHIIPEIYEQSNNLNANALLIIGGILIFFVLEKFLGWRHCHDQECQEHIRPFAFINLFGGLMHNIFDGMMIGASYLISIPIGVATTIAIILHEIPHELGDFGILVHGGLKPKKALLYNFFSACGAIAGTIVSLILGGKIAGYAQIIMPLTAGSFLYIAGSDLIPELHKEESVKKSFLQLFFILLGVGLMLLLLHFE